MAHDEQVAHRMAAHEADPGRPSLVVFPAAALRQHRHLLEALEDAFDIRFTTRDSGQDGGIEGLLILGERDKVEVPAGVPRIQLPEHPATPLVAHERCIRFTFDNGVPRPLQGRALLEQTQPDAALTPSEGATIMAACDGRPVWWREPAQADSYVSSYALPHLHRDQRLRSHLQSGCFMGLLPLVAFLQQLRGVMADADPLNACIVFDDPNLHWPSYGHIDYRKLVKHARNHGYHVSLATVPRDAWFVHPRAASVIRDAEKHVSLTVHGNDHVTHELGRLATDEDAQAAIAQALRRVHALQRRSGIHVDRVMVPPHERCSQASLHAMLRLGFEAVSMSDPHPGSTPRSPLVSWRTAEFVAGGLPVLPRHPLTSGPEELVFCALLRQPLILYGHHGFVAGGYDGLSSIASYVDGLGEIEWTSLQTIARRNFTKLFSAGTLTVCLGAQRVQVSAPEATKAFRVELPPIEGRMEWTGVRMEDRVLPLQRGEYHWQTQLVPVPSGGSIQLELVGARRLDPAVVPPPRTRIWPFVRRLLVEQRDRTSSVLPRRRPQASVPGERAPSGPMQITMLLENNPYPQDTRVRNEAETLACEGRSVTVIAPRAPSQPPTEVVEGVQVRRFNCPQASGSIITLLFEYAVAHVQLSLRAIIEVTRGTQAIHVHGPPDSMVVLSAAARLLGRRVVYDLHDSAPELLEAKFGSGGLLPIVMRETQKAAIRCANHVIVTNESQRSLVGARVPGTSVTVVRNGPRGREFHATPEPVREGMLADPRLIYVGALDVQDGVLELIELMAREELRTATLTVVGDGPIRSRMENLSDRRGVAARLSFTGHVPHDRVPSLIAQADIGVDPAPCTALNDGSTMIKVAEYLAAGRPLVCYPLLETRRTAADAALYAPCGDIGGFARQVKRLAEDGTLRGELARRATARGLGLRWEACAAPSLRAAYARL